ncbi:Protein of unknown function [Escherichia coli D6-117.29]|nr:Protein of unknown function [Escherichia coli D6-117.29]
MASASCS